MSKNLAKKAADIVRDAGGMIVGRIRLQKLAYLLTATGLENDLPFVVRHRSCGRPAGDETGLIF